MGAKPRPPEADVLSGVAIATARELRRARHWSALEMERRIRASGYPLPDRAYWKAENGLRTMLSVDELWALGRVLCVPPADLVEGRPDLVAP